MIYTLTMNPSLDYISKIEDLILGEINRSYEEAIIAGGKGINVSTILSRLGVETTALGFLAGFVGKEIENIVHNNQIASDFIYLRDGNSRINLKLKSKQETEINSRGPFINKEEVEKLFLKIQTIKDGDILVLAGSIPRNLDTIFYALLMKEIIGKDIKVIVDATSSLLINTLQYHPFLIKPNKKELEEIIKQKLNSTEEIIVACKNLQKMGARNILVSCGKDGAILVTEDSEIVKRRAPKGQVINSTGAGDSMVAGFLYGYLKNQSFQEAIDWGIICGSATAFSLGLASKEKILECKRYWK